MTTISADLYRLIISHIDDQTTLLSLMLSSRALNNEAERKLYRNFSFSWEGVSHMRHLSFLHLVSTCSRLARHVRDIHVSLDSNTLHWETSGIDYRGMMCKAFRGMVNLENLSILRHYGPSLPTLDTLLLGCTFQLITLSYMSYLPTPERFDNSLTFLRSQKRLRQLDVRVSPRVTSPIDHVTLPKLVIFGGCTPSMKLLLPAQNRITHLRWDRYYNTSSTATRQVALPALSVFWVVDHLMSPVIDPLPIRLLRLVNLEFIRFDCVEQAFVDGNEQALVGLSMLLHWCHSCFSL